ncbi:hypothetical protein CsSME_00020324 [Camellia sinensis var. sinensis]
MFQHNTDINFMSETSREQNTQSSDNHFISETSCVSRGKAFTIIEDETLCRFWLAVSQDPITGNSQTMVAEAKRMYHAIQKKHFTFDTCWDILR